MPLVVDYGKGPASETVNNIIIDREQISAKGSLESSESLPGKYFKVMIGLF